MSNIDFKQLKENLSSNDIINILSKFNVKYIKDSDNYCIFPTVCHNLNGGSPKLYYYKDSHMFKCYTECEGVFDIFNLIIKMQKLRGNNISVYEAIKLCGIDTHSIKKIANQILKKI